MGMPSLPSRVLPVGGFMVTPDVASEQVANDLAAYFRSEVTLSDSFSVQTFTHYYDEEMGEEIMKYFYYVHCLREVEGSEQWKCWSNEQETKYRSSGGRRRVNLDPGYLTLSKLVLFSTKGFAHRIYIRDRIFGEVTLQYRYKEFHTLPWTYRDYSSPEGLSFWYQAREVLDHLLKTHSEPTKD